MTTEQVILLSSLRTMAARLVWGDGALEMHSSDGYPIPTIY